MELLCAAPEGRAASEEQSMSHTIHPPLCVSSELCWSRIHEGTQTAFGFLCQKKLYFLTMQPLQHNLAGKQLTV